MLFSNLLVLSANFFIFCCSLFLKRINGKKTFVPNFCHNDELTSSLMWSARHKKSYLLCVEFWNIHETFSHFFSKQAKLRQPIRAETADFRFQISNIEIRQIAFLMTCRTQNDSSCMVRILMDQTR